jgi:hypothetical protein
MADVLTDHQLLIAEEDLPGEEGGHGLIATFLPVANLEALEVGRGENGLNLQITVQKKGVGTILTFSFPLEIEDTLYQFVNRCSPAVKGAA